MASERALLLAEKHYAKNGVDYHPPGCQMSQCLICTLADLIDTELEGLVGAAEKSTSYIEGSGARPETHLCGTCFILAEKLRAELKGWKP
jgi:hypothetical protein